MRYLKGGAVMSTVDFDQIWEAVKRMDASHRRRLHNLLRALRFKPQPLTPQDELELLLLKEGVIDHIPRPLTEVDLQAFQAYQPVPVQGKPVSETVVEDRR